MDTTETYVKMCEKAGEIQKEWAKKVQSVYGKPPWERMEGLSGDYYLNHCVDNWGPEPTSYDVLELQFCQDIDTSVCIFLPRQDQLQEMVDTDKGASAYGQLSRFNGFIDANPVLQSNKWTWEQLWLIYVMRWQYQKVWNGEEWVKA